MKLASYLYKRTASFGVVKPGGIFDVPANWPDGPAGLLEALQAGADALRRISEIAESADNLLGESEVALIAPIPHPPKIVALAGNYAKHIAESNLAKGLTTNAAVDTTPRPFLMPATAVAGPNTRVSWPCYSRQIDYEIELAVVIGAECKCVSPEQASDYIAGYTIVNDISARSTTFAEGRSVRPWDEFYDWLAGKWADGFCPMGPHLVTADEVGDPTDLALELKVNGRTRQKETTAAMIFDVYHIVSFVSHLMTLTPGDVIATGTPSGVGMADGRFLEAGDEITCSIERIGTMTNTLDDEPENYYAPCRAAAEDTQ